MATLLDGVKRIGRRVHGPLGDLAKAPRSVDETTMSAAISTLWRKGDVELIRQAMIDRYATVLDTRTNKDTNTTTTTLIPAKMRDTAMQSAILMGQYELGRLYLYDSVVRQTATLFSVPTSRFSYDVKGLDEDMAALRGEAGCRMGTIRWDALGVGCGSSALYVSVRRGTLWETEVPLTSLWWVFPEWVEVEGERDTANGNDLDDCGLMVMQVEGGTADKGKYLAWYGPCELYPLGRHCAYEAKTWHNIPDVGVEGCYDFAYAGAGDKGAMIESSHLDGRELANPLTLWAQRSNDWRIPTYPFSPMAYDPLSPGLLSSTTSLYSVCQEFDLASGLILGSALRGARGQRVLTRERGGSIPANAEEGLTVLDAGQTLAVTGWAASNAEAAMRVVDHMARHIAEAHGVPGWLVARDQAGEVPSGYAVKLMSQPLQDMRAMRAELNRGYVARRFDIERALVNAANGTASIPVDAVETWDAGTRDFPEDDASVMAAAEARLRMGVSDVVDIAREIGGYETREQTIAAREAAKAERDAHPDAFPAPAPAPVAEPMVGGMAAAIRARRAAQ